MSLVQFQFVIVLLGWAVFGGLLLFRPRNRGPAARRDRRSLLGMGLQAAGFALVWGIHRSPIPGALEPARALIVMILLVFSVILASSAIQRLGKQWSLAARMLDEHDLITTGPYAFVRHPIYTGVLGMLLATGIAVSTWWVLGIGTLVYLMGTVLRMRIEERLLRSSFGGRYDAYARRVPALLPRWPPSGDPHA